MVIDNKVMTLAILEALQLWMEEDFPAPGRGSKKMELQWFNRVINNWRVARLIRKVDNTEKDEDRNKKKVLEILNARFITNPKKHLTAKGIDKLDDDLKKRNLTSLGNSGKNKEPEGRRCTSLVSKIAFFVAPEKFPPWDAYARNGLKRRTGKKFETYAAFLETWNEQFEIEEEIIRAACKDPGWAFVAGRLRISTKDMRTTAFMRKVFDNVLNFENDESRSSSKWTRKFVNR